MLGCMATCTTPQLQPPFTALHQHLEPRSASVLHLPPKPQNTGRGCRVSLFLPNCQYHHPFRLAWLFPWASHIRNSAGRNRPHLHVHNRPYAPEDAFQALKNTFLIFFICLVLYLQNQHRADTQSFVERMDSLG